MGCGFIYKISFTFNIHNLTNKKSIQTFEFQIQNNTIQYSKHKITRMALLCSNSHGHLTTKYIGNSYIPNSCKRKLGDLNTTPDMSGKDMQFIIFRINKIRIQ